MNIAVRKLILLDKEFTSKEEAARLEGATTNPIQDVEFRRKVSRLVEQIRFI